MVLPWMLYCTAVSALLGVGALALEWVLAAARVPVRGTWAGALLLSSTLPLSLPAVLALRATLLPAAGPGPAGGFGDPQLAVVLLPAMSPVLPLADRFLPTAWMAASAVLLVSAVALFGVLAHRRRGWRAATVAGTSVLVSPDTGPAVVGFLPGRIVLPEWALAWSEDRRGLMVEHEREHLRSRDPLLLLLSFVAVALVPWNAAAWWQLRRLRLAVEMDCDARVLRRRPDVRAYGLLLLEVGRRATAGRVPAVALTVPTSYLQRRILAMTTPRTDRRFTRVALSGAVLTVALAAAAALPAPAAGLQAPRPGLVSDTLPRHPGVIDVQSATVKPQVVNAEHLQGVLQRVYPEALRDAGIVGMVQVFMIIDTEGRATEVRALEASRPEFGEAAVAAMREARFVPARLDGRVVAVRVQVPVTFSMEPLTS